MADAIERVYTIPLRSSWLKEPRVSRANRSIRTIKSYLRKHTKANEVKLSKGINEYVFKRGVKKPPGKITVEVKGDRVSVLAKLPGEKIAEKKEEPKKGLSGLKDRLSAAATKPAEPKAEKPEKAALKEEKPEEKDKKTEPKK